MTSFMALDGVTSFLRLNMLKDVINKRKRWRHTKYWREFFSAMAGKLEEAETSNVFASFL